MILVDSREPDTVKKLFTYGAEITQLSFGDFAFDGNGPDGPVMVGIERKSISDLIGSINSGRLSSRQVPGVMQTYDVGYLLVEGVWEANRRAMVMVRTGRGKFRETGMRAGALVGYLNTTTVMCGMHIIYTHDIEETANYVRCLEKWWQKPWSAHSSHKAVAGLNMPGESVWDLSLNTVARMAYQISGLGLKRAKAVGDHFDSVQEMAMADEGQWREVTGVGKGLAKVAVKTCRKSKGE